MSGPEEKIAAVVVTCNRRLLLEECLDSLLGQSHPLDAVYIVDNHSADGTYDRLLARELILPTGDAQGPAETVRSIPVPGFPGRRLDVHYVRLPENTGGAGGFHEGMKRALDAGFDWLWLMDDDLLVSPDALAALVEKKNALEAREDRPFLLNSVVLAKGEADGDRLAFPLQELSARGLPRIGVYHWRLSEVRPLVREGLYRWACPFNGTFVSARVAAGVGLPNKDFFISGDEKDFLWRAAKMFHFYTVVDSKVFHPRRRGRPHDWRQYYFVRNMIVVNRRFNFAALRNLKLILWSLGRSLRGGRSELALVIGAIRDGLAGRLGKRDDLHA